MLPRGHGCGCQNGLPPLQISPLYSASPRLTLLPFLPSPPSALLLPGVCTSPHMDPVGDAPSPQIPPFYTEGLLSGGWIENKAPLNGWQRIGVTGRGRTRKGVASIRLQAGLQTTPNTTVGAVGWSRRGSRLGRGCSCGCELEN